MFALHVAAVDAIAAVLLHLSPSSPLNHLAYHAVEGEDAELSVNLVVLLLDTDLGTIAYVGATLAAVIACRVLFPLSGQVHILAARD